MGGRIIYKNMEENNVYNILYQGERCMILNSSEDYYFLQDEEGNTFDADKDECEILFEV